MFTAYQYFHTETMAITKAFKNFKDFVPHCSYYNRVCEAFVTRQATYINVIVVVSIM